MMQAAPLDQFSAGLTSDLVTAETEPRGAAGASGGLSPEVMARHLLRADPASARCFAEAMWEGSAWANAEWGDYWADVIRLV